MMMKCLDRIPARLYTTSKKQSPVTRQLAIHYMGKQFYQEKILVCQLRIQCYLLSLDHRHLRRRCVGNYLPIRYMC